MAFENTTIPVNFVGNFKTGDNLVYNGGVLAGLIEKNDDGLFNKMAVLQAASILETSLYEIIFRAQKFNREGVPTISEIDRADISTKTYDKLNNIIECMKKYKLLDSCQSDIYNELHKLRKYRNKIHIHLPIEISDVPADEADAFSDEIAKWALSLCFDVLSFLNRNLSRPAHIKGHVADLTLPRWVNP